MKTFFTKLGAFVLVVALAVGTAWFVGFNPFDGLIHNDAPTKTTEKVHTETV